MGSNDHFEVPDPKPRNWRVAFKRWLARVLGVKGGLSITIPPGATLIMPQGLGAAKVNVEPGGTVVMGKGAFDGAAGATTPKRGGLAESVGHYLGGEGV